LTERETEILKILKNNPMISQETLAQQLNIQRSSVGVHISNLIKKGYIKGKGYIISDKDFIIVIGGSNMDISGTPNDALVYKDSNIGTIRTSFGGVGRNIADNLARLGDEVAFISAVGDDAFGKSIVKSLGNVGVNLEGMLIHSEMPTSTYLCINENFGDMQVAISQMQIIKSVDVNFIRQFDKKIKDGAVIVLDTNIEEAVIHYIAHNYKDQLIFADTVSTAKASKLIEVLPYLYFIKPNLLEAEILVEKEITPQMKALKNKDVVKYAKEIVTIILKKGVNIVALSLGDQGIIIGEGSQINHYLNPPTKIVNATGAGDAFMAGFTHAYVSGMDLQTSVKFAQMCSKHNIQQRDTVSGALNEQTIFEMIRKEVI